MKRALLVCRRKGACATAGLLLACAGTAWAEEVDIVGARIITGDGATIDGGTLAIRGETIVRVGAGDQLTPMTPQGRRIRAPEGAVVTAGLIDTDTALGLYQVELSGDARDDQAPPEDPIHPAFDAVLGLDPQSTLIPVTRMGGVTTVAVVPRGGLFPGKSAWIDLAGRTPAEMMVKNPVATYIVAGAVLGARGYSFAKIREVLDDAREFARRRADWEKNATRSFVTSRTQLESLQPALEGKLPVVIGVERASDILQALAIARDYGLRLILAPATEGWMVAGEIAAARAPVMMTPLANLPESFERLHARYDNAALLHRAGVKLVFSTFGGQGGHNVRNLRFDAGLAVAHGLPWDAALAAITRNPAEVFGVPDRGTLAPNKVANVVVWSGDPFEFATRPLHVFIRGREVPLTSRQTQLFAKYRDRALGKK